MRNFWVLFCKELMSFFISPVAYLVLFFYSALNGGVFAFWLSWMSSHRTRDFTVYQALVESPLFWIILMTQVPVITMRTFSEEYRLGTIEMLLTAPVREWEIVLAKFGATLVFFLIIWSAIPLNLLFLQLFSTTPPVLTWGTSLLPMLMIVLLGCFYTSIGIFTSSLTKNQILAAIFCFTIIFGILMLNFFAYSQTDAHWRGVWQYVSTNEHMDAYAHGYLDTRPIALYLSGTAFFLFLTQRILEGRRLKA